MQIPWQINGNTVSFAFYIDAHTNALGDRVLTRSFLAPSDATKKAEIILY